MKQRSLVVRSCRFGSAARCLVSRAAVSLRSVLSPNRSLATLLLLHLTLGCAPVPESHSDDARFTAGSGETDPGLSEVGWVVWESNRTGRFRIWFRELAGGSARRLSPNEPGRDHCCAHISPDGVRIAYLSIPGGNRKYVPSVGSLHLVRTDGKGNRVLAARARHYGRGHRAAVWWSEDEIVFLDGEGTTRKIDLSRGRSTVIAEAPSESEGWLVEPTGRFATSGLPTFSERDQKTGKVRLQTRLGGCEPYFTADGEYGFWTAGAGGPIDVIDLETRETRSLLRKNDARLPEGWRYLYFPMISRDRSLLAYAASPGEHDHFKADYDIFLMELDPESLVPSGSAIRISADPAVDRFPDVWRLARPRRTRKTGPATPLQSSQESAPPVFVWDTATSTNRRQPEADSEVLEARGAAFHDRFGRLALAGGFFAASSESAVRVDAGLRQANALSVGLSVEPTSVSKGSGGPILALTLRPAHRGFLLRQVDDRIELVLRTEGQRGPAGGPAIQMGRFDARRPHHLAWRFSPGRLTTFVDGSPAPLLVVPGDFYHWKNRHLLVGAERNGTERFRGYVSHLKIWDRELGDHEIAAEAKRVASALARRAFVAKMVVEATLVARSQIPRLDEISPYRQALVVEEYELKRILQGTSPPRRFRVARWALLDALPTRGIRQPVGKASTLTLEPFAAQKHLESVVLSDTLPSTTDSLLFFFVGLDDG